MRGGSEEEEALIVANVVAKKKAQVRAKRRGGTLIRHHRGREEEDDRPSAEIEQRETREVLLFDIIDMTSNCKWYTVFRGWDPGVYGTWYNHTATIEREVHDQLTLEEALAELDKIPPPPLPPRMWIEELYEAKGVPLPRSPSIDEEPCIDLFPRDRTLYQRVGSGYEYVMDPWWSD
ncbi:hypothetical protein Syun_023668 [Stephania yunnanensis]|uniref:Uncharacterized protein n=1 Tax=Stephania yunnanensis TaxID=152371 RepID=A0AAP0FJ72_9MAGN